MSVPTTVPAIALNLAQPTAVVHLAPPLFSRTTTGVLEPACPGEIILSVDQEHHALVIEFDLANDQYLDQNNYTADNSDMWQQEVFELFIAGGADTPSHYVEIQVNPNGALFSAWVSNPDGKGTENVLDFFNGHERGIETSVNKDRTTWSGRILFPLAILGSLQNHYRLNFFRIVSLQSHDPSTPWVCTSETCAFLAWSPTCSGASPVFHIPSCFGHLELK